MASIFSRKISFIPPLESLVSPVPDVELEGAQDEPLILAALLDEDAGDHL
jgi:hypothetical protein